MDTKDFIYYLLERDRQLVKGYPHSQFRPDVAVLTGLFEFACDFKNGKCAGKRDTVKCCCSNCASSIGHFGDQWPNNTEALEQLAGYFNPETGFWRVGKGCILPRHRRSLTCAFYVCEKIRLEFDRQNDKEIQNLRLVAGEYTSCHYRNGSRDGQYKRDYILAENDLNLTADKFMWDRKLYYDPLGEVLRKVDHQEINDKGWVTRKIEGREGHVGFNKGKKWVRYMRKEIEHV